MNKNGSVILGGILILIGIVWFLASKDIINLSIFSFIMNFWPAILIILGINILFRGNNLVKILSVIVLIALMVANGFIEEKNHNMTFDFNFGNESTEILNKSIKRQEIEETVMTLNLDYGEINVDSGTDKLIDFSVPDNGMQYFYTENTKDSKLTFSDKDTIFKGDKEKSDDRIYNYTLNEDVVWDVDLNSGAVDGRFDFSQVHLRSLSANLGAGDLYLKIGSKEDDCKIEVNSATIALEIDVDNEVGVIIKNSGAISEFDFDESEFTKEDDTYISKNYHDADKKLQIQLNSALSDISINRY